LRDCLLNQSTIHRAMKTGRLSYTVSETGERRIDTSELERVFGLKPPGRENGEASAGALAHAFHPAARITSA
jgi:hypothetical protein